MTKTPERILIADSKPPGWDDWMTHDAASAHIQQVVGSKQYAKEDLRLRLASGDVEAQERRVTPGKGIEVIPMTPDQFKGPHLPLSGQGEIFVRRTDVYRIWPIAGTDWMSFSAVSERIQQVVGGGSLAGEDLRLRLASGDVEAQRRQVTPGKGIEIIPLTPEDFKHRYFPSLYRFRLVFGDELFLRRADVERAWPIAGDAEPASPPDEQPTKQLPTKRPRGIGPRVWLVAREVDALMREGGKGSKWIDLDALLDTIRNRIGDNRLSKRTLNTALAYLRNNGFIDR
jgi:hypothetical protein